jgi:hypothetical protein
MEYIAKNKDIRISLLIKAIKQHADLKKKLAEDIETYDGVLTTIFDNDNILKLCNLDKEIGAAFVSKGLVKEGRIYGYRIVK